MPKRLSHFTQYCEGFATGLGKHSDFRQLKIEVNAALLPNCLRAMSHNLRYVALADNLLIFAKSKYTINPKVR